MRQYHQSSLHPSSLRRQRSHSWSVCPVSPSLVVPWWILRQRWRPETSALPYTETESRNVSTSLYWNSYTKTKSRNVYLVWIVYQHRLEWRSIHTRLTSVGMGVAYWLVNFVQGRLIRYSRKSSDFRFPGHSSLSQFSAMLYPGFQWGAASPQNAIGDPLITMARRNRPSQIIPPQLEYNHTVKRGCNVGYYIF